MGGEEGDRMWEQPEEEQQAEMNVIIQDGWETEKKLETQTVHAGGVLSGQSASRMCVLGVRGEGLREVPLPD